MDSAAADPEGRTPCCCEGDPGGRRGVMICRILSFDHSLGGTENEEDRHPGLWISIPLHRSHLVDGAPTVKRPEQLEG